MAAKADRPLVFLAFRHNKNVGSISKKLKVDLERREVIAYRAMDDPRPGDSLTKRLETWIGRSDGVVIFWSGQAARSPAVRSEYETAKRLGKKICLVKFRGVLPPSDLGDIEWLALHGVRRLVPPSLLGPPVTFAEPSWSRFVDTVAGFARRARTERLAQEATRRS